MQFEAFIPKNEDESTYYAESVTIDPDGIDLKVFGETYSASFQEVDKVDLAMAVLEDDFSHLESRAARVQLLGSFPEEDLENMGWIYLRAAQISRQKAEQAVRQAVSFA